MAGKFHRFRCNLSCHLARQSLDESYPLTKYPLALWIAGCRCHNELFLPHTRITQHRSGYAAALLNDSDGLAYLFRCIHLRAFLQTNSQHRPRLRLKPAWCGLRWVVGVQFVDYGVSSAFPRCLSPLFAVLSRAPPEAAKIYC